MHSVEPSVSNGTAKEFSINEVDGSFPGSQTHQFKTVKLQFQTICLGLHKQAVLSSLSIWCAHQILISLSYSSCPLQKVKIGTEPQIAKM